MLQAYYSKKFSMLTLFIQKNVSETVNCYSKKQAIERIKRTRIEQTLVCN